MVRPHQPGESNFRLILPEDIEERAAQTARLSCSFGPRASLLNHERAGSFGFAQDRRPPQEHESAMILHQRSFCEQVFSGARS
jgi:hypothetical protein